MPAAEYLGWLRHYLAEPWGNREKGIRTGLLAAASAGVELDPEDFIVKAPTKAEQAEIDDLKKQAEEFDAMQRKRRRERMNDDGAR